MLKKVKNKWKVSLLFLSAACGAKALDILGNNVIDFLTRCSSITNGLFKGEKFLLLLEQYAYFNFLDLFILIVLFVMSWYLGKMGFSLFDEFFNKSVKEHKKLPTSVETLISNVEYLFGGGQTGSESQNEYFFKKIEDNYLNKLLDDYMKEKKISNTMLKEQWVLCADNYDIRCFIVSAIIHQLTSKFTSNFKVNPKHLESSFFTALLHLNDMISENFFPLSLQPTTGNSRKYFMQLYNMVYQTKKDVADFNSCLPEIIKICERILIFKEIFKKNTFLPVFDFLYQNKDIKTVVFFSTQKNDNQYIVIEKLLTSYRQIMDNFYEKSRGDIAIKIAHYHQNDTSDLPHLTMNNIKEIKGGFLNTLGENLNNNIAFYLQGITATSALFGYIAESSNSFLITNENNTTFITEENPSFVKNYIAKFSPPTQIFQK